MLDFLNNVLLKDILAAYKVISAIMMTERGFKIVITVHLLIVTLSVADLRIFFQMA